MEKTVSFFRAYNARIKIKPEGSSFRLLASCFITVHLTITMQTGSAVYKTLLTLKTICTCLQVDLLMTVK